MKIDDILIKKAENGTIVEFWDDSEIKTKVFSDQKKLFEFIKEQLKKDK